MSQMCGARDQSHILSLRRVTTDMDTAHVQPGSGVGVSVVAGDEKGASVFAFVSDNAPGSSS
jgi:hypothetical protein